MGAAGRSAAGRMHPVPRRFRSPAPPEKFEPYTRRRRRHSVRLPRITTIPTTAARESPPMFDLAAIQAALQQFHIDAWLLYDFRGSNPLARRVARIPDGAMLTRRWFYFVPARGEPRKLQHRIEPHALDHLPGAAFSYLQWQQL